MKLWSRLKLITTLFASTWFFLSSAQSQAQEMSAATSQEIQQLLAALEGSGCQFERNGRLYSGADARKHLQRKLDYLQDHLMVQSTEEFIEQGASTSSSSGKSYQVHCQGVAAVTSQQWLMTTLQRLRSQKT